MSKRLWALPVLAALLVAGSGVGYAIPSLGGPTGVVSLPNALVAPTGQLQAAVSYQKMDVLSPQLEDVDIVQSVGMYTDPFDYVVSGSGAGFVSEDINVWSLQALAGVAEGAELWAAYSKADDVLDTNVWGLGGKYKFASAAMPEVAFAIGASYQKGDGDANLPFLASITFYDDTTEVLAASQSIDVSASATKLYAVATEDFAAMAGSEWCPGSKLLGSLGLLYMKVNEDIDLGASVIPITVGETVDLEISPAFSLSADESLFRPFVTVQWISADKTYLGLEYRWKDDDLDASAVFSAVLGKEFEDGWTGEIGTTNANAIGLGLDDQNWFVRVGYNFATGAGW
jgi:hypothetical protein